MCACNSPGCTYRAQVSSVLKQHRINDTNRILRRHPIFKLCDKLWLYSRERHIKDWIFLSAKLRKFHLEENDYLCAKCSYATGSLRQLKDHCKRVHDPDFGVSRFTCEWCGFRAITKIGLSIHGRTHAPEGKLIRLDNLWVLKVTDLERNEYLGLQKFIFRKIPVALLNRIDIQFL